MLTHDTRFVFRMSGTGSTGATVRIYVNTFSTDPSTFDLGATVSHDLHSPALPYLS